MVTLDQHLQFVAWRNAELYRKSKALFEREMRTWGWSDEEIKRMEEIIERECWGNGADPKEPSGT